MLTVMTGGSNGLGKIAATLLAASSPGLLFMGKRKVKEASPGWHELHLDLEHLESVHTFVDKLPQEPVSRLILNAGGQWPNVNTRTADGLETTFVTNHLSHYLLLRLLMPRLTRNARIVITTSGTHDPAEKTGVPPPRHADVPRLSRPELDPIKDKLQTVAGMRAYASSKLCNLLVARYLANTPEALANQWQVFAYDPGLTPGTGLVRNQAWIVRTLVWPLVPLFIPFAKGMNTLADSGRGLFELATTTIATESKFYASLRRGKLTWPMPSVLAMDDQVMNKLWHDSALLLHLNI
jgi:NAD(P)-dependent dehydrogenase (short-subunit alcohol dehydrogenase family)